MNRKKQITNLIYFLIQNNLNILNLEKVLDFSLKLKNEFEEKIKEKFKEKFNGFKKYEKKKIKMVDIIHKKMDEIYYIISLLNTKFLKKLRDYLKKEIEKVRGENI